MWVGVRAGEKCVCVCVRGAKLVCARGEKCVCVRAVSRRRDREERHCEEWQGENTHGPVVPRMRRQRSQSRCCIA